MRPSSSSGGLRDGGARSGSASGAAGARAGARSVDFNLAAASASGGNNAKLLQQMQHQSSLSAIDQRIVSAVQQLQTLVGTETKWKNRIVASVTTASAVDLSVERMNEFQLQCQQRIAALRDEVVKIAEKQLLLVSFDPAVFKQWFQQLTADPAGITPPPAVAASYTNARSVAAGGSPDAKAAGRSKRGGGGGGGAANAKDGGGPQYLDGVPVPESFWQRRENQKNALAAVYLAVFDLPRLHRERPAPRPTTADEMLFHLREATRLAAAGPAQLKDLLQEHRNRERDIAAGISAADARGGKAGGAGGSAAAAAAARNAAAKKAAAGGGAAAAMAASKRRPSTAGTNASSVGGASSSDGAAPPTSGRSCLQTGIFVHDPAADDLALTTDLRPGDFFDVGSPRCLDQRVLHRVMVLRSRRLRLEECIAVFGDEKAQLQRRNDVQKEMTHLGQYALSAAKREVEVLSNEERALQRQRVEELTAAGEDVLAASKKFANTLANTLGGGAIGSLMDAASPKRKF